MYSQILFLRLPHSIITAINSYLLLLTRTLRYLIVGGGGGGGGAPKSLMSNAAKFRTVFCEILV